MENYIQPLKNKKVLCIRLDSIGDVIMTSPAIRAIKETSPESKISLLTSTSGSSIANYIKEIDEVIEFDADWVKNNSQKGLKGLEKIIGLLKSKKFDIAIIFTVYSQNPLPSAMLAYMADIPIRIGYCHENPYKLLTHWIPDPEPVKFIRHEVRRQLDLVSLVGCKTKNELFSLSISKKDKYETFKILFNLGIDFNKKWIVMHPGASEKIRRYSAKEFAKVGQELISRGFQVLITGGKEEIELTKSIQKKVGVNSVSLGGKLSLAQFISTIEASVLAITNNTSTSHIAAAVKTPVIVLYAKTNPQHIPWQSKSKVLYFDVPCKACRRNICIGNHSKGKEKLSSKQIIDSISDLFNDQKKEVFKSEKNKYLNINL
ncbi:MAG: lipopolysaccharide heptosyltransferase II [Actinobacteria bacterium]|nr:lipopolysaccharide heptosyltransferase II [Actinomycetota bacterium]